MYSHRTINRMKKLSVCILTAWLLMAAMPASLSAAMGSDPISAPIPPKNEPAPAQLLNRLDEIRGMDKSTMEAGEKKALRKEVKSIKQELRLNGSGIYLSTAGVIIIILLLILLL